MSKTFMDAVEACERVGTQAGKLEAIKEINKHHQRLIHEALNKHRRFNVKKWDEPKYSTKDYPIFIDFYKLLDDLVARKITGNAAREAVTAELSKYTKRTAGILARVLRKDLDCGADAKTWLKVYPEMDLPNFKVMKAKKVDDASELKFPRIAELKYDGYRLLATCEDGEVAYYTSSGRKADFCNGQFDEELRQMEDEVGEPIVVDGEALGTSFQDVGQARGKKGVENKKRLRFYAFDMMKLSEWTVRKCPMTQKERSEELRFILESIGAEKIIKSDSRIVNSVQEAAKFFEQVRKGVEGKNEGLMFKDPDALYEWDRSKAWLKLKFKRTYDLIITGFKAGKGKFKGTLGSLECKGEDENGRKIEASVAGMDDKTRAAFWANQKKALGLTVEVEADKMTKAKNSDVWSLRFGQYKGIRNDK